MGLLIEISATEKDTDELIINRGFCRRPALQDYCEQSQDKQLQDFASLLYLGITLDKENIEGFLTITTYVIQYLSSIKKTDRSTYFPIYQEVVYNQLLDDLNEGLQYLTNLAEKYNLDEIEVDVM